MLKRALETTNCTSIHCSIRSVGQKEKVRPKINHSRNHFKHLGMLTLMAFAAIVLLLNLADQVYANEEDINVYIHGELLEFDEARPIIRESRTLVPFRRLSEAIGVDVTWEAETQRVVAHSTELGKKLTLTIGSETAHINGEATKIDVVPQIHEGRTLIPLRFFNETFGMNVDYQDGEIWLASARDGDEPLKNIRGTLSGFYTLGDAKRSSWTELFGAPYPEVSEASRIHLFDHIHLGWFEITSEGELTSTGGAYGFQRPRGYEMVLGELSDRNLPGHLMVFARESEGNLAEIFNDEAKREKIINSLFNELEADNYAGINLDIEELGLSGDEENISQVRSDYVEFVTELNEALKDDKKLVVTVPPPNSAYDGYDYHRLGAAADKIVVMAYDYHSRQEPSATAPINRVEEGIRQLVTELPNEKIVLGLRMPAVRYREIGDMDYEEKKEEDKLQTVEEDIHEDHLEEPEVTRKWRISHPYLDSVYEMIDSQDLERQWDESAGMSYINFEDEKGLENYIYFECEASLGKKWELVERYQLKGVSLWRLGVVPDEVYEQLEQVFK